MLRAVLIKVQQHQQVRRTRRSMLFSIVRNPATQRGICRRQAGMAVNLVSKRKWAAYVLCRVAFRQRE